MLRSLLTGALYRATATRFELPELLSEKWLELTSLRHFLSEQRIDVVLDVGANEGQFAAKLRRLGFTGAIVSFEPDPRAFTRLAERHGRDAAWKGHPIALGDSDGTTAFNLAKHSVLSSFLTPVQTGNLSRPVEVQVRRLDHMWDEIFAGGHSPRVLLKTDTQGFDLHVLRGASACLDRVTGILAELPVLPIYEESPSLHESLAEYRSAGFDLVDLSIVNRTPDGRVLEFDGLFINRSAVAQ
jgi:FkbM family methyltransferase